jgi:DNA-binding response OmpR family regulator
MNAETKPCILIAEDEMFVAMMLEDLMERAGYRVIMVARLAKGLALAGSEPIDAAVLDINLAGEDSFPLADALRRRGIPFMFASGYGGDGLAQDYAGTPVLQKPYDMAELKSALVALLAAKSPA